MKLIIIDFYKMLILGVHNIQGGYTTGFKSHHHINANHRVTSTGIKLFEYTGIEQRTIY